MLPKPLSNQPHIPPAAARDSPNNVSPKQHGDHQPHVPATAASWLVPRLGTNLGRITSPTFHHPLRGHPISASQFAVPKCRFASGAADDRITIEFRSQATMGVGGPAENAMRFLRKMVVVEVVVEKLSRFFRCFLTLTNP